MNQLSDYELFVTTEALERYAGNFFRSLAPALRYADPANRAKLLEAFPDIVKDYGPGTAFFSTCTSQFDDQ